MSCPASIDLHFASKRWDVFSCIIRIISYVGFPRTDFPCNTFPAVGTVGNTLSVVVAPGGPWSECWVLLLGLDMFSLKNEVMTYPPYTS